MKRFSALLCAVVVLALIAAPLAAVRAENPGEGDDAANNKRAKKAQQAGNQDKEARQAKAAEGRAAFKLLGMTMEVATDKLKLTPEQVTQLEAIVAEATKAETEWNAANGEKMAELREKAKAARENEDKEAAQETMKQMGALNADLNAKISPLAEKAMAVLTPEQKTVLVSEQLASLVVMRWRKLELTDEQKQAVQQAAEKAAVADAELNPTDRKAMMAAAGKLSTELAETVLTQEQRDQLPKRPQRPANNKRANKNAEGEE